MNDHGRHFLAVCTLTACLLLPSAASAEALTADAALNEAIRNNPSLRAAVADLAAAHALTTSEAARYDATMTFSLGATHTETPSLSPGTSSVLVGSSDVAEADATLQKTLSSGTQLSASVGSTASRSSSPYVFSSAQGTAEPTVLVTGPGYLFSAKAGVTQPLLRGAGNEVTTAHYRQAVAQESATKRERDRAANALARDVLLAYWELWYASKAAAVDAVARDTSQAQRDDAMLRARTGSLAPADVLAFQTQLATKEETLMQSELERTSRQNELARLLGRGPDHDELEVSELEPPVASDLPAELQNRAQNSSPDVSVNEANVAVARVEAGTAADPYRPRLDLDAYVQAQGLGNRDVPSAFSQLAGFGAVSAHVGLTFELPLTGTRYQGEARRARATLDAAHDNLGAARNQVAADVATLARKHELARERIAVATVSTKYAEEQLAAERALFASGSATALEVTQAEDNVQAVNKRLARARADVIEAALAIEYHLDTLLKGAVGR